MKKLVTLSLAVVCLAMACLLAGCGPSSSGANPQALQSAGQVSPGGGIAGMPRYAAARAADQVSFGATPALVDRLAAQGLNSWITDQMALPVTQMVAPGHVITYDVLNVAAESRAYAVPPAEFFRLALTAPDQMRLRVTWALMQFVPINGKVKPYGMTDYFNLLQRQAFGNYGDFLRELTTHPAMGNFLDNAQNRPVSPQCTSCAPNENYARELLQLFTLGVVQLNPDGTTIRDAQGKPRETYTQEDVEELAGALTGWRFAPSAAPLPNSNWANFGQPMVPEDWAAAHDRNAKTILGTAFSAGRDARQELDAVVALLMQHPNIAPFVSLRLIQHLVTSNPTSQYVGRVAAVFRNNGQGVAGDMKSVIRAVLLDAEARRGDLPGADTTRFGKLREPVLWYTNVLRGLGCSRNLVWSGGGNVSPPMQPPFSPPSVFSFYLPTDRAPGSNLLAPEQKLLTTNEFTWRLGGLKWALMTVPDNATAGCDTAALGRAFNESPRALIDQLNARWFRGAMPPTLRSNLEALATGQGAWATPDEGALTLMFYALSSPYFGVIK
jgi:uncharacterized protein (DUF1800 family)